MKIGIKVHLIIAVLAMVLISSLLVSFRYFIIPQYTDIFIGRSWNMARFLQNTVAHLSSSEQQELLMDLIVHEEDFSYLVILDKHGRAVAHSDPGRIGMLFNDAGTLEGINSKQGQQQIYTRDKDHPASPYYGEKVIDVVLPFYKQTGESMGAVNVGLSLQAVQATQRSCYIIIFLAGVLLLIMLIILDWSLFKQVVIPLRRIGLTNEKIQEALRESEEKFSAAFRLSPEAISISSLDDGRYVEVNDTWEEFFGYSRQEAIDRNALELNIWGHSEDQDDVLNELKYCKTVHNREKMLRTKSGDLKPALCSFTHIDIKGEDCVLFLTSDISVRKQLEDELLKASKLESVGVLAGGIAHDFNNLLTVIVGNLALAQMNLKECMEDRSELMEVLIEAEKASFQARGLTQQLLTFAKGGAPIRQTSIIEDLIRVAAGFALSGSNVLCEFCFAKDLSAVDIDEGQISQVINNLIINAVQAMPDGGRIKISAKNISLSAYEFFNLAAGNYIQISIEDEGVGIPEDMQNRIFDPYFTTKDTGSGLGLATSYSIIRKHEGHISLESKLGKGTTFQIYLPASTGKILTEDKSHMTMFPGRGRILVMDDEERIRDIAGQILDSIGYQVEMAQDGAEAIEKYQAALHMNARFDAVIIDLTIPGGMGGKETMLRLLEIDPAVKVIVSSGYSNNPIMADYQTWGFKGVIAKPYGIRELSATIGRVLNEEGDTPA